MDRLCILNVPLINRYIDILDLAPLFVLIDHHHNVKSTLTTHDCGGLSMNVSEYVMCIVVKRLWKNHLFSNHASHTIIGYFGLTEWYYPDYFLTFQCRTLKWPQRWMSLKPNCCTIHCRRYKKLLCLGIVFLRKYGGIMMSAEQRFSTDTGTHHLYRICYVNLMHMNKNKYETKKLYNTTS